MSEKSLVELFGHQMRGIAHAFRDVAPGFKGFAVNQRVEFVINAVGDTPSLTMWLPKVRGAHHQALVELRGISPASVDHVTYGPMVTLERDPLPGFQQTLDNRDNDQPLDYDLSDALSKASEKASESSKSAGGSVSVTISAKESVEGFAEFDESVTAEVHAEVSSAESQSESSGEDIGAAFRGTVSPGSCKEAVFTQARESTAQEVKASGHFAYSIGIGLWDHTGPVSRKRNLISMFVSLKHLTDLVDNPHMQADNEPLIKELRANPVRQADDWAFKPVVGALSYHVTYQGMLVRVLRFENC